MFVRENTIICRDPVDEFRPKTLCTTTICPICICFLNDSVVYLFIYFFGSTTIHYMLFVPKTSRRRPLNTIVVQNRRNNIKYDEKLLLNATGHIITLGFQNASYPLVPNSSCVSPIPFFHPLLTYSSNHLLLTRPCLLIPSNLACIVYYVWGVFVHSTRPKHPIPSDFHRIL